MTFEIVVGGEVVGTCEAPAALMARQAAMGWLEAAGIRHLDTYGPAGEHDPPGSFVVHLLGEDAGGQGGVALVRPALTPASHRRRP